MIHTQYKVTTLRVSSSISVSTPACNSKQTLYLESKRGHKIESGIPLPARDYFLPTNRIFPSNVFLVPPLVRRFFTTPNLRPNVFISDVPYPVGCKRAHFMQYSQKCGILPFQSPASTPLWKRPTRKFIQSRGRSKRLRPVFDEGGRSTRGKLRLTLLNHRFRVQHSGSTLDHASPTILSRSAFYLVMAPINVCYVAAPSEAIQGERLARCWIFGARYGRQSCGVGRLQRRPIVRML